MRAFTAFTAPVVGVIDRWELAVAAAVVLILIGARHRPGLARGFERDWANPNALRIKSWLK